MTRANMSDYSESGYDNVLNKSISTEEYINSVFNNATDTLDIDETVDSSTNTSSSNSSSSSTITSDSQDTTDDESSTLSVSKLTSGVMEAGEFIVGESGRIRSGQTAYDTGSGWWLGDVAGVKKFSIGNSAGNKLTWDGTNLTITGSIIASSGRIANWYINTNTLSTGATEATSSILIDSSNSLIRLGSTGGNYLLLDGANLRIRSSNYASGVSGAGFTLEPDLLEVGNISARGLIRTACFQKDVISAVGGSLEILDSDVLSVDMTALDSCTLTTKGLTAFSVGDLLRCKDGIDDEWFEITNITSAPTYTVTRDKGSDYSANNNPTWKKGATIINYGQSGEGGVHLTASETNAPYLSIFTHAGSPWDTLTQRVRLGNLSGITDPVFGALSGYGLWTDNIYLTGSINSSAGKIGGFDIGADYIRDTANSFGMASTVTAGTDMRFWAGSTFANRATAPFRIDESGNAKVSSLSRDDFHWFTVFESIDGYTLTPGAGSITTTDGVRLTTGSTLDDITNLQKNLVTGFSWDKSKKFKTVVYFNSVASVQAVISLGARTIASTTERCMGFHFASGAIYGITGNGTNYSQTDSRLATLSATTNYTLECIYDYAVGTVKFYIDGTYKDQLTTNLPTGTTNANYVLNTEIKTGANAAKQITLRWWDFWQAN